jgi:hypothetical protein
MWEETLVISIHSILTELMPLTEDFQQALLTILPSLPVIREIFISNIPLALSPLSEEVLIALDLFESQLATLASLQDFMIGIRQGTKDQMKEIKLLVASLKSNNQGLTNEQKVALTIKRLAIANQMNQLRTYQEQNIGQLESLRDLIDINNLTQLNVILADLIVSAEARQVILTTIQDLFEEAITILQA